MYKLKYFASGDSFCGSDFERDGHVIYLNLTQLSSFTDLMFFTLPVSGNVKSDYAVVSMQNGDKFYINKTEQVKLLNALGCKED